jgi:uncharacterized protein YxjI
MNDILNRNLFFVKEHLGIFKAANNYDILDPQNGQIIMECREKHLGFFTKLFRFTKYKRMTPFNLTITSLDGRQIVRVSRGVSIFLSKVTVFDENNIMIGGFKQKLFSLGGAFTVFDRNEYPIFKLNGNWMGWDFTFTKENVELARVTKKWAGIGKELFTSADNYILEIRDSVRKDDSVRQLILAAVICIDFVLKE